MESSTSSSDSDAQEYDVVKLKDSQNAFIRLIMFGRIKKIISGFEGKKLKTNDRNIIRGLFKRKLKDYSEELRERKDTLYERMTRPVYSKI